MHRHRLPRAAALPLLLLASCDVDLLEDASFDVWCGDALCSWIVEVGEVARAPTWHSHDYGVALIGEEVVLSQASAATHNDVACIRFDLLAEVDSGVSLSLELDFLDDGTAEYSAPLASDGYQPATYTVTPPAWFEGLRIRVRKQGDGNAVIGQLRARGVSAEECPDAPLLLQRPLGAPCINDADCQSGACTDMVLLYAGETFDQRVCSVCDQEADCDTDRGETCGTSYPAPEEDLAGFAYRTCEPAAQGSLGDHCQIDAECGDSLACVVGQCAECDPQTDAEGDCARGEGTLAPYQDAPGAGLRASGEGCLQHSDCQSGTCQGEDLRLCSPDGRRCDTDADCPILYIEPVCTPVGIDHGTCQ